MVDVRMIRVLAASERLMDKGEIPFVWMLSPNGNYERMAVTPNIMQELGLVQGQIINWIIQNAIAELSTKYLTEELDDIIQRAQDLQLKEDFDFRKEMDK